MDLGTLQAVLALDSSAFQEGLNQASSALSSFSAVASGVFEGIGASSFFDQMTGGFQGITSFIVGATSDMQGYSQTIDNTLNNLSSQYASASGAVDSGTAKQKASFLEAQDALITYNEKIATIQQNISDVMAGQNIIDAVNKYQDQLSAAQEAYADKVSQIDAEIAQTNADLLQTEQDNAQKMQDTLADMQMSHGDKMADTREKQAQQIADTTSAVEKVALQKKFNEENQLAEDSYNRAYATKKTELQRSLDEENERAKDAADKKLATYQTELQKEASLEAEKEAKLKAAENAEIERLQDENDKKLALYQKELADEERSYALSQAKRAASGGAQGGGGAVSLGHLTEIGKNDPFAAVSESLDSLQGKIIDFALKSPFNLHDIEQADQGVQAIGLNVEKMNPIIGDLAGHWHTTFSAAFTAIQNASLGNSRILQNQFHVTKDDLTKAFGGPITSVNDFATAMQNLDEKGKLKGSFKGGQIAAFDTLPGQMSNVQDQVTRLALAFVGFQPGKTLKEQDPNSLFMILFNTIKEFSQFLKDHRDEFAKALEPLAKSIGSVLKNLVPLIENVVLFATHHAKLVATVAIGISIFGTLFGIFISLLPIIAGIVLAFAVLGTAMALLFVVWIPLGIAIVAALAAAYTTNFLHIKDIVNTVIKWVINNFEMILVFLGPVGLLVMGIKMVFDNWKAIMAVLSDAVGLFVDLISGHWEKLWKDLQKLFGDIVTLFNGLVNSFADWGKNLANSFVNAFMGVFNAFKSGIGSFLSNVMKAFQGKSPPTEGPLKDIDKWGENIGMAWVSGFQKAIGSVQIPNVSSLTSGLGGSGTGGTWNYNSQSNLRTSNVVMNNAFNINSQASAVNMVQYLAFQSNHFGAV